MDDVFRALADPSRRRLLDDLNRDNGQTLAALATGLAMSRQAVSKHLGVLEAANLVTTLRRGREKLHYLNAEPINAIADRWISQYDRARVRALGDLKTALENRTVKPEFVYTTYIHASLDQVYDALTQPEFTTRYWGVSFDTEWVAGAAMTWHEAGATIVDPEQLVVEADRPHRLSYTWHTFSAEWAAAQQIADEVRTRWAAERRSRVTFELEAMGPLVKLTVVHDDFDEDSEVLQGVSGGWPMIIASLKSMLETGEPLPAKR